MRDNKNYEVTLTSGKTEIVYASEVEETATRIKFTGNVPGISEFTNTSEIVKSYRDSEVSSYRLIPTPERDANAVGMHVFRVNHTDGTSRDVKGDYVMHAPGTDGKPGRYSIATEQWSRTTVGGRTEYLVPEDRVVSIERFGGAVPVQPPAGTVLKPSVSKAG